MIPNVQKFISMAWQPLNMLTSTSLETSVKFKPRTADNTNLADMLHLTTKRNTNQAKLVTVHHTLRSTREILHVVNLSPAIAELSNVRTDESRRPKQSKTYQVFGLAQEGESK